MPGLLAQADPTMDPVTRGWLLLALVALVLLVMMILLVLSWWIRAQRRRLDLAQESTEADLPDAWQESGRRLHVEESGDDVV